MTVRPMPFAHWSPNWSGVAFGFGAIGALALTFVGQADVALMLLAGLGAAGAVLFAAGQLHFSPVEGKAEDRIRHLFSALPAPIAITNKKGAIRWSSDAFMNIVGGLGLDQDISRLGEGRPETAAAIFRLISAARAGMPHAETIHLPHFSSGDPILLKTAPFKEQGNGAPLISWRIDYPGAGAVGERPRQNFDALPIPALLIGMEMSVEGANKAAEKLLGFSPAGKQAWTLFRSRRGNPLTRARLQGMIAKTGGAIAVQIVSASGHRRAASLHVGPEANETQAWLVTPADIAASSLEEFIRGDPCAQFSRHGLYEPEGRHTRRERFFPAAGRQSRRWGLGARA